ncbi:hypothetical protein [Janthinobacterium sp. 75]|uniref:hypothetical protein n=1 Tax=Janthinobacterium sp. 75 TaxID=2135628 RepID=UPI0010634619|nr:hypothetical protein [Janthinobacterium sp. 75]TDY35350.1 hypothetical protein C8C89_3208 [Janthinobacterium sp. 75]
MKPTLAIIYASGFPNASFHQFADALKDETLTVHLEEREPPGPMAGLMWTMLTASALFIASSYFGGMLKELGKDHYEVLKRELAKLTKSTMDEPRIEPVLFGTAGKLDNGDPISMGFSIWAQLPNGYTLKLLIPKKTENVDYAAGTDAFLDFVLRCHEEGDNILSDAGLDTSSRQINPITLMYNAEIGRIEWANPIPKAARS